MDGFPGDFLPLDPIKRPEVYQTQFDLLEMMPMANPCCRFAASPRANTWPQAWHTKPLPRKFPEEPFSIATPFYRYVVPLRVPSALSCLSTRLNGSGKLQSPPIKNSGHLIEPQSFLGFSVVSVCSVVIFSSCSFSGPLLHTIPPTRSAIVRKWPRFNPRT